MSKLGLLKTESLSVESGDTARFSPLPDVDDEGVVGAGFLLAPLPPLALELQAADEHPSQQGEGSGSHLGRGGEGRGGEGRGGEGRGGEGRGGEGMGMDERSKWNVDYSKRVVHCSKSAMGHHKKKTQHGPRPAVASSER